MSYLSYDMVKTQVESIDKSLLEELGEFLNYLIYKTKQELKKEKKQKFDPFYSEENMRVLALSIQHAKEGKLTEHEIVEA